jgi:spore coat protein CotH
MALSGSSSFDAETFSMSKRTWAAGTVTSGIIALAWSTACWPTANPVAGGEAKSPLAKDGEKGAGKGLFGLTRVHQFHLEFSAKEWARLQPAAPRFPLRPGGGPANAQEKAADTHRGGFGMEFPWARGELTALGKTCKDVGLRYKGNFTYMASSRGLKRPWKIELGRHVEGQRFLGLKKLNLNNGHTDPTKAREALSYAVFRAAGVPASRTAFAELTLTVPGKYDKEYVGLYTLVEQVDRIFLQDRFKSRKGMLLKPEGLPGGLPHFGEDWKQYAPRYRPRGEPDKKQQKRLIDFTRLINKADDARFRKEIGSYLDIDPFLRFLAVNALLANLDSFLGFGHNFYLYLRPDTDRFVFIPWDLDLSLGTWPMGGTPEQQVDLSVMHPHRGQNKLIDRLLAIKDVKEKYWKLLGELTATCFTRQRLLRDVAAIEKATKEPLAREARAVQARKEGPGGFGFGPPGGVFGGSMPPRTFVEKRTESVAAQLAGKRKGYVPPAGFGFGPPAGFGGPPPQPGQVMPRPLQDQLKLTAAQRKKFAELQKQVDRKVQEILTVEQRALLERLRNNRPGGLGGPPPGPGRP